MTDTNNTLKLNMGPLPKSDRNDELEELSHNAFADAFPVKDFRVRAEPGKDRGVDRYLEVKSNGYDTNCRAQVQLKSMETAVPNADGSISKAIEVTNFNYILNGPCPMYCLYILSLNELRFAWARDEVARLENENPEWESSGTITIRFMQKLDGAVLGDIHSRIISENALARKIQQTLLGSAQMEQVSINIDPATLRMTNSSEAKEKLMNAGKTLVSNGFPSEALELFSILSPADKAIPNIQLVAAYAEYTRERFDLAMGHLRECLCRHQELSEEEYWFSRELQNACLYRAGRKSRDEYIAEEAELASSRPGLISLIYRLRVLRDWEPMNDEESSSRIDQLNEVVREIKLFPKIPRSLLITSESALLYESGRQIVSNIIQRIGRKAIQDGLVIQPIGLPDQILEQKRLFEELENWRRSVRDLIIVIQQQFNPVLFANIHYTEALVTTGFLTGIKYGNVVGWIKTPEWFMPCANYTRDLIEKSIAVFEKAQCLESSIRAKVLLAELDEILDNPKLAIEIVDAQKQICIAMGYTNLVAQIEGILSGNSHYSMLIKSRNAKQNRDWVENVADLDDDRIIRYADDFRMSIGLPPERTKNIANDIIAMKGIAKEKYSWCRHIELVQNLEHATMSATAYISPMEYRCRCYKLHLEPPYDKIDWIAAVDLFKTMFCINCQYKEPRQP